jgi:hypothetical protein
MRIPVFSRVFVGLMMLAALAQNARAAAPVWSLQTPPDPAGATGSALSGVSCPSPRLCVAVGHFADSSGRGMPLAERWNGTRWSIQPTPAPAAARASLLFDVSCTTRNACVAVGSTTDSAGATIPLAERWNGSRWSAQRLPTLPGGPGHVSYLGGVSCPSRRYCAAVGYSGNGAGTSGVTLVERWNGTSWSRQRLTLPADATASFLNAVSCVSAKSCTAVGFSNTHAGLGATLGERWNGTSWSIQRTPTPAAAVAVQLVGVSCTATGPCVAAGYFAIDTGIEVMLAERGSGAQWSIQRPLYPRGATGVQFADASCASAGSCTAVGFFGDANGLDETLAERYNGAHWIIQDTPNPAGMTNNSLAGVSCTSATTCTAVGSFTTATGTQETLAEREAPPETSRRLWR